MCTQFCSGQALRGTQPVYNKHSTQANKERAKNPSTGPCHASLHTVWGEMRRLFHPISLHVKFCRAHNSMRGSYSLSVQHNDDIHSCRYINSWIQTGMDQFSQFL